MKLSAPLLLLMSAGCAVEGSGLEPSYAEPEACAQDAQIAPADEEFAPDDDTQVILSDVDPCPRCGGG